MKKTIKLLSITICVVLVAPIYAQKIDDFTQEEREFFSNTQNGSSQSANPGESTFSMDTTDEDFNDVADAPTFEEPTVDDSDFEQFGDEPSVENELENQDEFNLEDSEETNIADEDVDFDSNNEDLSFDDFEDKQEVAVDTPAAAEEPVFVEPAPLPQPPVVAAPAEDYQEDILFDDSPQNLAQEYSTFDPKKDEIDVSISDLFEDESPSDVLDGASSSQSIGVAENTDDLFEDAPIYSGTSQNTYEEKLYKSYKNLIPVDGAEWNQLVQNRGTETYTVQRGDTLWDLSNTFFGDPYFWTKIWSVNSQITNPHLIYPGQEIHFIMGDSNKIPLFTAGKIDGENGSGVAANRLKKNNKTANGVPESFPSWETALSQRNTKFKGKAIRFKNVGRGALSDIHSYISQTNPSELGRIASIEQGLEMASLFQYLFIAVKPGTVSVNDKLLVVRNAGRLKTPKKYAVKRSYSLRSTGEVRVVKQVFPKSKRQNEYEYFRAIVEDANSPIEKGSYVVRKELPQYNLADSGITGTASGNIIGGERNNSRQLLGLNSLVFIKGGRSEGFEVNQTYPVYSKSLVAMSSYDTPTGKVKIVDVEDNVSTAVILDLKGGLNSGDQVGMR